MSNISQSFVLIFISLCCVLPGMATGAVLALWNAFAKQAPHLEIEKGTDDQGRRWIAADLEYVPRKPRRKLREPEEQES